MSFNSSSAWPRSMPAPPMTVPSRGWSSAETLSGTTTAPDRGRGAGPEAAVNARCRVGLRTVAARQVWDGRQDPVAGVLIPGDPLLPGRRPGAPRVWQDRVRAGRRGPGGNQTPCSTRSKGRSLVGAGGSPDSRRSRSAFGAARTRGGGRMRRGRSDTRARDTPACRADRGLRRRVRRDRRRLQSASGSHRRTAAAHPRR